MSNTMNKNIETQLSIADKLLSQCKGYIDSGNTQFNKIIKVRDGLNSFYTNNKFSNFFNRDENLMRTNFIFKLGHFSGIILRYKKTELLTKEDMKDLNLIYKTYK